jgi:hypothetical protein
MAWGQASMLALLLATGAACSTLHHQLGELDDVRRLVHRLDCRDGQPAKILIDPHCQDGICGVTCAPDRWTVKP